MRLCSAVGGGSTGFLFFRKMAQAVMTALRRVLPANTQGSGLNSPSARVGAERGQRQADHQSLA